MIFYHLRARRGTCYPRSVVRLPAIALCLLLLASRAAAQDRFLGVDKAQHFALSSALAAGWYGTLTLFGNDPRPVRLVLSTALALAPGLLKELYDSGRPGKAFSRADLAWDLIGAATGSLLALALDWLLTRPRVRLPRPALYVERGAGLVLRFP
jgi:uncharacterized protein YfiM (DUF2279 family)